jgi:hypothetical protein
MAGVMTETNWVTKWLPEIVIDENLKRADEWFKKHIVTCAECAHDEQAHTGMCWDAIRMFHPKFDTVELDLPDITPKEYLESGAAITTYDVPKMQASKDAKLEEDDRIPGSVAWLYRDTGGEG